MAYFEYVKIIEYSSIFRTHQKQRKDGDLFPYEMKKISSAQNFTPLFFYTRQLKIFGPNKHQSRMSSAPNFSPFAKQAIQNFRTK